MAGKPAQCNMVRYNIECASCKTVLGIITVFGEVQSGKARGILGSSGFYQIKLDSCSRCTDAVKRASIEFYMASDIIQKINDGASLADIKKYLQTFAPPENDFKQAGYPLNPGEPPSFEDMQKGLPDLFKGKLPEKSSEKPSENLSEELPKKPREKLSEKPSETSKKSFCIKFKKS